MDENNKLRVISLGWGTQSFTLAAMAALGEIPPVDAAIHADTRHESILTYAFAKKWTPWLEERGVRVITIRAENTDYLNKYSGTYIPAFTQSSNNKNGVGQLKRQCTKHWKLRPINRAVRGLMRENGIKLRPNCVDMLIGISLDEVQRVKPSDVNYITKVYPLIDLRMTRDDCKKWLLDHGIEIPPRSACVFCPYKSKEDWIFTKTIKEDWEKAVKVDYEIRNFKPGNPIYVHRQLKPLDEVEFDDDGYNTWENECTGYCGL